MEPGWMLSSFRRTRRDNLNPRSGAVLRRTMALTQTQLGTRKEVLVGEEAGSGC